MEATLDIPVYPVTSSQIAAVGHDPVSSTLRVQFKGSGSTYDYAGVGVDTYNAFVTAESIGKFFGAHVKGKYPFTKLPKAG